LAQGGGHKCSPVDFHILPSYANASCRMMTGAARANMPNQPTQRGGATTPARSTPRAGSTALTAAPHGASEEPLAKVAAMARMHDAQLRALQASHDALKEEVDALRGALERAGLFDGKGSSLADRLRANGLSNSASEKKFRAPASASSTPSAASGAGPAMKTGPHARGASPQGLAIAAATPSQIPRCRSKGGALAAEGVTSLNASASSTIPHAGKSACEASRRGADKRGGASRSRSVGDAPREPSGSELKEPQGSSGRSPRVPRSSTPPAVAGKTQLTRSASARQSLATPAEDASPRQVPGRCSDAIQEASKKVPERSTTPRPTRGLYELAKPLLEGQLAGVSATKARLETIRRALASQVAYPDEWNGPSRPLSAAVQAGHAELTKVLLTARASVNWCDSRGVTALHLAVFDGQVDLCGILLQAQADPDSRDQHGQTPLFFAPMPDVCRRLLKGRADINALNRKGHSALHLAKHAGLDDVVAWLSENMSESLLASRQGIKEDDSSFEEQPRAALARDAAVNHEPQFGRPGGKENLEATMPERLPEGQSSRQVALVHNNGNMVSIVRDEDAHPTSTGVSPVAVERSAERQNLATDGDAAGGSDEELIDFCNHELLLKAQEASSAQGEKRGSEERRVSDGTMPALPATSELRRCTGVDAEGASELSADRPRPPQGGTLPAADTNYELPTTSELADPDARVEESW